MSSAKPKFTSADLKSAERLSVILHKVGHDIGNPLTSIISLASLLERASDLPQTTILEKLSVYGKNISSEAWRVAALNEKVVLLLSQRSGHPEPLEVEELVQSATRFAEKKLQREIPITIQGELFATVCCDKDLASWALYALIENAVIHGDTTPTLTISTETAAKSVSFEITNSCHKTIPDLAELFEPFVVLDENAKRSGLGLTVVVAIAERIGGSIEIANDDGVFHASLRLPTSGNAVKLPRNQDAPDDSVSNPKLSAKKAPLSQVIDQNAAIRVAVIEDDHAVGTAIEKILRLGFKTKGTAAVDILSGEDFLDKIQDAVVYNAILCDMNLGMVSGNTILHALEKSAPGQVKHFAFLSGDRIPKRETSIALGRWGGLSPKPFEADELLKLVTKLATA